MNDAKQESGESRRGKDHGSLPVIEETLQVDKRVIDKDRIRIIKKVEEETVEVPLVSRTTAYSIERIPMNQYVEEPPPAIRHEGNTMILSIVEEEVFVHKRLKVVEELRITLDENETITHTAVMLKKERVIIEKDRANS